MAALHKVRVREVLQAGRHLAAGLPQHLQQAAAQLVSIARVHEQTHCSIAQGFAARVQRAGQDRDAARQGFQVNNAESLAVAGHHKRVRQPVVGGFV